jgi:hypothetical protein
LHSVTNAHGDSYCDSGRHGYCYCYSYSYSYVNAYCNRTA